MFFFKHIINMYFPSKRYHLFEFHDHTWFPSIVRDYITDLLQAIWVTDFLFVKGPVKKTAEIMCNILKKTRAIENTPTKEKTYQIVDLCSGSGGPNHVLAPLLNEMLPDATTTITLTDLFPNVASYKLIAKDSHYLTYEEKPVDATNCHLPGFRTMYNCFHHMTEDQALAILENAVLESDGIAIFELTERKPSCVILGMFGVPVANMLFPLISCQLPLTFGRFFLTYIMPVVPFFATVDGMLSCLRTYSEEDYFALAKKADPENKFNWSFQSERVSVYPLSTFVGLPKQPIANN